LISVSAKCEAPEPHIWQKLKSIKSIKINQTFD
jgi:hypothetical protein